jgi:NADPH:quinone reductase-like Zn-dependent oxidoreductase
MQGANWRSWNAEDRAAGGSAAAVEPLDRFAALAMTTGASPRPTKGETMTAEKSPTWFITGASSGFGMAFARYALERGYNVTATARSPEKLQSLATELPNRVLVHRLDVTIPSEAEEAVSASLARFGRIDLLRLWGGGGV